MAIRNKIFRNCNDNTNTVVLQYNDIFFSPGSIASYNGECWEDTFSESNLVPVADVTFDSYESCDVCYQQIQVGVEFQSCDTSQTAILTMNSSETPPLGSFTFFDGECWEVISYTDTNGGYVEGLSYYDTCEICQSLNPTPETQFSAATFVNCCTLETAIFNIFPSNFGFPFGTTVLYQGECYTFSAYTLSGPIVATYNTPTFSDCSTCLREVPCTTPTPTPTVTYTPTPTSSVTPTVTPTNTLTPTPTKTPFLTPSPSYTTTTTTRPTEVNECSPITLFPMGLECEVINPTTQTSNDGSISLIITGGTPPYSIVWSNNVVNTTVLNNLGGGSYTAYVVDYYGDFSAQTTCEVILPTPTPTPTPSITPTLTPSPTPMPVLCVTYVYESQPYAFEFTPYTTINGQPAWSAATYNTPITNSGGSLILQYAQITTNPSVYQWIITGYNNSLWYATTQTTSTPPLSGWYVAGFGVAVTSITAQVGPCPLYQPLTLTLAKNDETCAGSFDGSIFATMNGGSGSFEYSIDGINYGSSNAFYNLGSGNYTIYVRDLVTLSTAAQSIQIVNSGAPSVITLGFTQVSSVNNIISQSTYQNTKIFSFNTGSIPNGVTVNLSMNVSELFQLFEPGDGNNVGSNVIISKNSSTVTQFPNPQTNSLTNRPGCQPYKIQGTQDTSSATVSLTNSDTLTVTIVNKVTITDPSTDGCITRVENTINVTSTISTVGLQPCVTINNGNLNLVSSVSRNLGS